LLLASVAAAQESPKPESKAYWEAYFLLGDAYAHLKRWDEAIGALKQSLLFAPANDSAHYGLGVVYIEMGDKGAAMKEYEALKERADLFDAQLKEAERHSMPNLPKSQADSLLQKIQERFKSN
jgi:tetratricopeptide (TPR) repeat protein